MIVAKKKIKKTQLNTIKQIYKKHCHMNDISQKISYDVVREQCTEIQSSSLKLCTSTTVISVDIAFIYSVTARENKVIIR